MARVFHPALNTIAKASVVGLVLGVGAVLVISVEIQRSPWVSGAGVVREQPVPFSHAHHVGGLGIDCRYCHTSVENSPFAGFPPTHTCMSCHSKVWTNAPVLQPVRDSWRTGQPLNWQRVNNLPNFVYFRHDVHIQKGVGCVTCHGRIDQMPLTQQGASLQMEWCLTCHREPERFLRPREQVFSMTYQARDQFEVGRKLAAEYHVLPRQQMENCSLCHR